MAARPSLESLLALPAGEISFLDRPDGTRLRCVTAGSGSPVVFAHGYLGSMNNFNLVVPDVVRRGHRVVLFDHRGHGRSSVGRDGLGTRPMADDYRAVLEHFDVEDAILVGHSMGAFLTIALSIEHTAVVEKRVRGLVLVGGHAGGAAKSSAQNRLQSFLLKRGLMKRMMRAGPLGRGIARTLFGKEAPYVFLEATRLMMLENDVDPTIAILNAMLDEDHYSRIGSIPVPARVICGRLDRTCPPFHSERLGAQINGSKTIWLDNVGHMVNYEQPSAFLEQIAALAPSPRVAVAVEQRVA